MGTTAVSVDGVWRTRVVAIWLVVFANGPLFFAARYVFDRPGSWEGPILRPAIVVSIGAAVALVALDSERLDGRRLRAVPAVPFAAAIAFGMWATLTTFWSLDPDITLWRGIGYVFLPFVAWVIADLDTTQWRRALALGSGFIVVGSLIAVAVRPRWGTDFNDDWRGLMTNRNGLGPICGLALMAGAALFVSGRRGSGGALVAASTVCLLGTGSRTAILAVVVALGVATTMTVARRAYLDRARRSIAALAGGLLVGGAAAAVGAVGVLWNESTFVQRRTIWDLVGDRVADSPLHGHGWEAFWYSPELHTDPLLQRGSAHGTLLELLLGGGVVALALWLVVAGYALAGVALAVWRRPDLDAWLWLSVVVFLVVENLTESYVLWFSYNWILLIAGALRFGPHRRSALVTSPDVSLGTRIGSRPARQPVTDRAS